MTRAGSARTAGAVLLLLALTGGCGSAAQPAAPRTPAPVTDAWPGCEAVGAFVDPHGGGEGPPHVGGVPSGFTATRAVLCEQGSRTNAVGDTVSVDLERTSTQIDPLLAYLARPDERATDGACPAVGFLPPWLFLLDGAGRYVAPAIPRDGCGLPVDWQGSHAAWRTPPYTDRVVREGEVTETADAQASGCGPAFKSPVPELADDSDARGRALGRTGYGDRPLRVCVWTVDPGQDHDSVVSGTFRSGRTVEGSEQATLVQALEAAPAGPVSCRRHATAFATVEPVSGDAGRMLWVELDGCRRVDRDVRPGRVARADDDLVGLLAH